MVTARLLPLPEVAAAAPGLDHVTLAVRDVAVAKRFYSHALRPLGLRSVLDWPAGGRAHFGLDGEPSVLWIVGEAGEPRPRVAFDANDRVAVQAFHSSALAAGGRSLDPPRVRDEHTSRTFAASVIDPDGNVVEAFAWDPSR